MPKWVVEGVREHDIEFWNVLDVLVNCTGYVANLAKILASQASALSDCSDQLLTALRQWTDALPAHQEGLGNEKD